MTSTSAPTAVDPELLSMMNAVFTEYRQSHSATLGCQPHDRALWQRLEDLGLVRLTGSESSGGSGASWHESAELLSAAVRHGIRLPLAEHDLLAGWFLEATGQPFDSAAIRTVALLPRAGQQPLATPWASACDRVVVVWWTGTEYRFVDADADALTIAAGFNLIGEPRDVVTLDTSAWEGHTSAPHLVTELKRKAALIRAIQVCAALDCTVAMAIEHSSSRVQFGRPLAKFQAIQNLVADCAAEAALSRAATEAALNTALESGWASDHLAFQIAVARSCAGHAASVITRAAHQVHGAMGTTAEHRLHESTRAALAWRSEYGSVHFWDTQVASAATSTGSQRLWALITGTP